MAEFEESPPRDDADLEVRKAGWRDFVSGLQEMTQNPRTQQMLIAFGSQLTQDLAPGQSAISSFGQGGQAALNAAAQVDQEGGRNARFLEGQDREDVRQSERITAQKEATGAQIQARRDIATEEADLRRDLATQRIEADNRRAAAAEKSASERFALSLKRMEAAEAGENRRFMAQWRRMERRFQEEDQRHEAAIAAATSTAEQNRLKQNKDNFDTAADILITLNESADRPTPITIEQVSDLADKIGGAEDITEGDALKFIPEADHSAFLGAVQAAAQSGRVAFPYRTGLERYAQLSRIRAAGATEDGTPKAAPAGATAPAPKTRPAPPASAAEIPDFDATARRAAVDRVQEEGERAASRAEREERQKRVDQARTTLRAAQAALQALEGRSQVRMAGKKPQGLSEARARALHAHLLEEYDNLPEQDKAEAFAVLQQLAAQ